MEHAVVKNLSQAMTMVKDMYVSCREEWSDAYRQIGRRAIATFLRDRMKDSIADYLGRLPEGAADRRNGSYQRHLLTEIGDLILSVPRTRAFNPVSILEAYARRGKTVDRLILACFLLGLSTRKVGEALLAILGETISPATVSRVAKTLDTAVAAFHRRKLSTGYRALIFDGIVLSRKTGMGASKRPVLVVLGIRYDGKKEVIDFRLAASESAAEWDAFLTDLAKRGLTGQGVEVVSVDGGKGLLSVLPDHYPSIPVQRCWAHKMRNILDKVRMRDREAVKKGLRHIYSAVHILEARMQAGTWKKEWEQTYPAAVHCLFVDIEDLLTCFQFRDPVFRKSIRTTNLIERRFKEVRRRTRPMGVFSDRTSMDRILYAVFMYENKAKEVYPVFLLTQKS
ncbi:MAG: transposase mutator type [Deltaproteobacteria bacterium]|nr:transposase mutator type [Deltaproteobacteria bacterium]